MRLMELNSRNFKGLSFKFNPGGKSADVYGENATGKTTLADELAWLLFEKDSAFKSQFEIKPINADGSYKNGLETEVIGKFDDLPSGKLVTLKKIYKEKWTKPRGSAKKVFSGNTVEYFVDDVPVKMKEYKEKVAEIADEETFKLLSSPFYFSTVLPWAKRRSILMEVCGDISDEEVIKSSKDLKEIPALLAGKKQEDYKKILAAKRTDFNKQLNQIPTRIDEVQRSIPDLEGMDPAALRKQIDELIKKREGFEKQAAQVQEGGAVAAKKKALAELETEILQITNTFREAQLDIMEGKVNELDILKKEFRQLQDELGELEKFVESCEFEARGILVNEIPDLKEKFKLIKSQELKACKSCGYIDEDVQAERKAALDAINEAGKEKKEIAESLQKKANNAKIKITELGHGVEPKSQLIAQMNGEIEQLKNQQPDLGKLPEQKKALESEIAELQTGDMRNTLAGINDAIQACLKEQEDLNEDLAKFKSAAEKEKRIEELKEEERRLSKEFEELERQLFLMEQFTKAKVEMLESKINSRFEIARFKLFKENINGGLEDCCESLYNGIPFNAGLNHSAQINVGLDIIRTLSDHYKIEIPCFIDNAEAVTDIYEIPAQMIRLIVSGDDKKLRVELHD